MYCTSSWGKLKIWKFGKCKTRTMIECFVNVNHHFSLLAPPISFILIL